MCVLLGGYRTGKWKWKLFIWITSSVSWCSCTLSDAVFSPSFSAMKERAKNPGITEEPHCLYQDSSLISTSVAVLDFTARLYIWFLHPRPLVCISYDIFRMAFVVHDSWLFWIHSAVNWLQTQQGNLAGEIASSLNQILVERKQPYLQKWWFLRKRHRKWLVTDFNQTSIQRQEG